MIVGVLVAIVAVVVAIAAWPALSASVPSTRVIGGVGLLVVAVGLGLVRQFALAVPAGIMGFRLLQGAFATSRAAPQPGRSSEVRTDALAMRLDHDSGAMDGEVLKGRFEGKILSQMSDGDLWELVRELGGDTDSLSLLHAYIDRHRTPEEEAEPASEAPDSSGHMSEAEAYGILGLEPGAGLEEVRNAHHRLIKAVHPDVGGSSALAAMINAAKTRLGA